MSSEAFEPVLSSDETEALLSAMRGGAAQGGSTKEVELGSPDHRLRQSLGRADVIARELAAEVRKILRRLLTASAMVREGSADVVPFNVVSSAVGPGYALGVLRGTDGSQAFIVAGANLVSHVITRRLGGAVASAAEVGEAQRPVLSAVDRRIIKPFLNEVLELLNPRLGRSLALELVGSRAVDLPAVPQFEPLVRIPLTVQLPGGASDELSILLTAGSLPIVEASDKTAQTALPSLAERTRLAARLSSAEIEITAQLGQTKTSVRRVLSLQVGDVLRLDEAPDQPIELRVEGTTKMLGSPVVRHGNIAIEITEVLKGDTRD